MRIRFSNQDSSQKNLEEYKGSTEFKLRRVWEQRYQQPSWGNPLFEDTPLEVHVVHLTALFSAVDESVDEQSQPQPDDHMLEMMDTINKGGDPFSAVRDKLSATEQDLETITF